MLHEIIEQVSHLWRAPNCRADITFVDDGFSELMKWRSKGSDNTLHFATVFSLGMDVVDLMLIKSYKAKRILFCLSCITADSLRKVRKLINLSGASDAIILTLVSPDAFKSIVDSSQFLLQLQPGSDNTPSKDGPYDSLRSFLKPECVDVIYYPVHCFPVMTALQGEGDVSKLSSMANQFELFNLASPICRDIKPLTLHSIGQWNINENIKYISDVSAGDIPLQNSIKLKHFAHELAGTLIFDLGLDPSSSIYALGNTSSLIGRHLQPLLGNLNKMRSSLKRTERMQSSYDGTEILLSSSSSILSSSSSSSSVLPSSISSTQSNIRNPPRNVSNDSRSTSLFPLPPKNPIPTQNPLFPLPKKPTKEKSELELQESKADNSDSNNYNNKSINNLQLASLLLIDRTQDLYSPCSHSGETSKGTPGSGQLLTPPLAHRILCTLLRGNNSTDNNTGGSDRRSNGNGNNNDSSNSNCIAYDINLLPPFNVSTIKMPSDSSSSSSSTDGGNPAIELDYLRKSFPAVSSLALQLPMSLFLPEFNSDNHNDNDNKSSSSSSSGSGSGTGRSSSSSSSTDNDNDNDMTSLHRAIFASSEEEGRRLLCAALTAKIVLFKGILPISKKGRGLGAEVLALVQALVIAPGSGGVGYGSSSINMESSSRSGLVGRSSGHMGLNSKIGFNPKTCLSTQTLLSFSMLVVEAMQRSSKKQFLQYAGDVAVWMASCEVTSNDLI